jgi:hypothetical protein
MQRCRILLYLSSGIVCAASSLGALAVSLKDDTNNEMDDNNNITIWTDRL